SMELNGACALVTGASRGIGRAIALTLGEAGADVALTARNESELKELAGRIQGMGRRAPVFPADLLRPGDVRALAEAVEGEFSRVDILINNAGAVILRPTVELSEKEFEEMIELNLTSVFRLTRLLLPGMLQRRCGHIVMIASTAALRGFAGGAAYAAAKFGLNGFAQSLFYETRSSNVRVTTIYPSSVNTDMTRQSRLVEHEERLIQPVDIARAVVAALQADDRATLKEIEVWGTNP
ncbi:MAG: short chain dehydrogenase, partial [Acidobacteria bacterium]